MEQPQIIEAEIKLKHFKKVRKQIEELTAGTERLNAELEKTAKLVDFIRNGGEKEDD